MKQPANQCRGKKFVKYNHNLHTTTNTRTAYKLMPRLLTVMVYLCKIISKNFYLKSE